MAVIGIDIDGTLALPQLDFVANEIPAPDREFLSLIEALLDYGHTLWIWTTRPDYLVKEYLRKHRLLDKFSGINTSPYPSESGKASFDYYIGDDAVNWNGMNGRQILRHIGQAEQPNGKFARDSEYSNRNPRPYFQGVGRAYVDMFEPHWLAQWQAKRHYKPICFLTICSHAKPYSKSYIHTTIRSALYEAGMLNEIDYVHISNAGIVPAEAEEVYPFNAYDWNGADASPDVVEYHKSAIRRRLAHWYDNWGTQYGNVIVYLRKGGNTANVVLGSDTAKFFDIVLAENEELDVPLFATPDPDNCLTSFRNLRRLREAVLKYKDILG